MLAEKVSIFLKTQEFRYKTYELKLDTLASTPAEVFKYVEKAFKIIWSPGVLYRASGVTLSGLRPVEKGQIDLFGQSARSKAWDSVFRVVDAIDKRYGSHTLTLTSSLEAYKRRGGAIHKRLRIPFLGEVI